MAPKKTSEPEQLTPDEVVVEPEPTLEDVAPEPVQFRFDHDQDDAVLTVSIRGGHELVLTAGESYSTVNRHEIRALDAHQHVDRVTA